MAQALFTFADGKSALYTISARKLVAFPVWEANRVMDQAHVSALETAIQTPKEIQGPFSVVTYVNEETGKEENRIIDGQHRQEVLRRYFERVSATEDFPVLCRRYRIANHDAAVAIFQQINHCKPMVYKGSPTERLHEIVAALRRHFVVERKGGAATFLIREGCNRPALNVAHLETALKAYGIHERTDLTVQQIVDHAEKMNGMYAEDPQARVPARATENIWNRAIEAGFYLGLDPHCGWLAELATRSS
jgi:hypothetical protein